MRYPYTQFPDSVNRLHKKRRNERLYLDDHNSEEFDSEDIELGYALDAVCKKHSGYGMDTIDALRECLWSIMDGANSLGCSMYLQRVDSGARYYKETVPQFLRKAEVYLMTDEDNFFEVTYMDGENPGNQYMLTLEDFDGHFTEFAEFIFIVKE